MDNLLLMLAPLFSSKLLLVLFFGTLFGLILGVLPGLGPTTGGALILPFTMTLDPLSAIVLLTSIYCAGTYGGAITAVLINTPGTPAAAATCLDGYPLAQKGEAGRALGMATVSSTVGGIFSVIILVFFAPILNRGIQPATFPKALLILIIVMTLIIYYLATKNPWKIEKKLPRSFFLTLFSFILFVIVSKTLDFFLAISALSIFVSYYWGEKRLFYLLLVGIIFPITVFIFFETILGLRFPPGIITNIYYS